MIDISKCRQYLTVKDYSVSQEEFCLLKDESWDLLLTHPQPDTKNLASYYESEDYISHTDGKRSWFERTYQWVKNIAIRRKLRLINELQREKGALLDIGTGTGDFILAAMKDGWQALGVEPSVKARRIAMEKNAKLIDSTSELPDQSIDVITMWHVLEHVPDLEKQIKELKRLLKPEGTIIIAVPNFNSYDAKHYGSFWAAYDVPRHLWHFSRKAMGEIFAREKLQVITVLPMYFDAFYVALLSEKYKRGRMNFINALLIGLKSNWSARTTGDYSSQIYVIKNNL